MPDFSVPYGKGHLSFSLPEMVQTEVVTPRSVPAVPDAIAAVEGALADPVGGVDLATFRGARSAAIAINDKTRPVPHQHLLPPLLRQLEDLGLSPDAILLVIATGAHAPMPPEEYPRVVPEELLARYRVLCHDADADENLRHLGTTSRGTPVWINRHFAEADWRIVVGNIEPHQFQGFSGGAKSAAIGLAGRDTVNRNHALMTHPRAQLGRYQDNPARQDVEEIGDLIGVHLALNAILNGEKEIVQVLAGEPRAVMRAGIPPSREVCQVTVAAPFDLVIASPGGHPKDLNLYQSQKALAHASLIIRDGGAVILAAACPEGVGSRGYERWMEGMSSHEEVLDRFRREPFHVGPHKALLMSRDAARVRVVLVSAMAPVLVRRLLLTPAMSIDEALCLVLPDLPRSARVGVMPRASSTIPLVVNESSRD
jgi:nickel-dependent lactate racemase